MKESRLVSVIVPIYNTEKYLDRCIDSILNQTYKNLEVICVDDGSTDDSVHVIEKCKKIDNRIVLTKKNHKGVSAARNEGITISHGDYIAFVDSDDYIDEKFYEIMVEKIGKSDICVCDFNVWLNDVLMEKAGTNTQLEMGRLEMIKSILKKQCESHVVVNKLFKRSVIEKMRFPEGYTYEDIYGAIKTAIVGKIFIFIPDRLYHYCRRGNSIYTSLQARQLDDFISIIEMVIKELEENGDIILLKEELLWYLLYSLRRVNQLLLDIHGYNVEQYKVQIGIMLSLISRIKKLS